MLEGHDVPALGSEQARTVDARRDTNKASNEQVDFTSEKMLASEGHAAQHPPDSPQCSRVLRTSDQAKRNKRMKPFKTVGGRDYTGNEQFMSVPA